MDLRDGLIGAGGTPLQILGCTNMELTIAGGRFPFDVIVVYSLMMEGILGVDFMKKTTVQHRSGERITDPGQWEVLNCPSEQVS